MHNTLYSYLYIYSTLIPLIAGGHAQQLLQSPFRRLVQRPDDDDDDGARTVTITTVATARRAGQLTQQQVS
jgi:hypothetical protein